jgi:hypothetical protein
MRILLLLLFTTQALSAVEPVVKSDSATKQQQKIPVEKAAQQQPAKQKKSVRKNWPRTFVPSDKIGADSIVTFPADI